MHASSQQHVRIILDAVQEKRRAMLCRGGSSEARSVQEGYTKAYQGSPGGQGGALVLYARAYYQIRKQRAVCGHGAYAAVQSHAR